ncbi:MAG: S-layer homology domain-containing protein [Chloroflexia bacterium]
MWKRISMIGVGLLLAAAALVPLSNGLPDAQAAMTAPNTAGAPPPHQNPYSDAWLAANHGKFDNIWTAEYESRLQAGPGGVAADAFKGLLSPLYGPDVRMSNGSLLGSGQNEFQIDINPANSLNAIGTSNDGGAAGVGIFRTTDGGLTWSSRDASVYGVPAACCDPGVAFGTDGKVYAIILDTSPSVSYIIRSTDGGATWQGPSQVATPDRENIAVDPNNSNNVYITYSELPGSNRIKGYKSTDGGVTWGPTFFVGDVAPAQGYEQSSQPRVASDGTLYVGYQQYTNSSVGCSAGVQNVLAKSTNGGVSFTYTVLPIVQGGACSSAQAGRGIFCINGSQSFRSRSHPIIGVSPTNPNHVYMVYSGGDLETPYTCAGATGFHSDTLFRISTDGGATFSPPTKVNTDPSGKDQYYPWMSVTASGQIWIGWNDRREDTNDFLSRWYQSYSNDEGATFRKVDGTPGNDPVADVQTQPSSFIGDYHGLGAVNGNVLGMWFDSRISSGGDAFTDPQVPPPPGTATPTAPPSTATSPPANTATATSPPANTATPTTPPANTATATSPPANTATATVPPANTDTPTVPPADTDTPTAPPADTATPTILPVSTASPTTPPISTATATAPPVATATPTACAINFSDVHMSDYFYVPVQYLYCHGVISGYSDGTFRPYNPTTRSQMVKIVVLGFQKPIRTPAGGAYTFTDVPPSNNFYAVIETAAADGIVSGYNCGTAPAGPCDGQHRPYFLPYNNVTRGQLAKIDVIAAGWAIINPATPSFTDVPRGSTFYTVIETAHCHGVVDGYSDGTFRPYNDATRGQISKIVYLSITNPALNCGP